MRVMTGIFVSVILLQCTAVGAQQYSRSVGQKQWELVNYQGNVVVTTTDRKQIERSGTSSSIALYEADVVSHVSYYPYGLLMEGPTSAAHYRFGFQGQERDDEVKGVGSMINYAYRMHDARIGRFFSIDALDSHYPHLSSYSYSENRVVDAVELEGNEGFVIIDHKNQTMTLALDLYYFNQNGSETEHPFSEVEVRKLKKYLKKDTELEVFSDLKSGYKIQYQFNFIMCQSLDLAKESQSLNRNSVYIAKHLTSQKSTAGGNNGTRIHLSEGDLDAVTHEVFHSFVHKAKHSPEYFEKLLNSLSDQIYLHNHDEHGGGIFWYGSTWTEDGVVQGLLSQNNINSSLKFSEKSTPERYEDQKWVWPVIPSSVELDDSHLNSELRTLKSTSHNTRKYKGFLKRIFKSRRRTINAPTF